MASPETIIFDGIRLSQNFDVMTYQTMRSNQGIAPLRGKGKVIATDNFYLIDKITLKFTVNRDDLINVAKIYARFRTKLVLPIHSSFVQQKIISSNYLLMQTELETLYRQNKITDPKAYLKDTNGYIADTSKVPREKISTQSLSDKSAEIAALKEKIMKFRPSNKNNNTTNYFFAILEQLHIRNLAETSNGYMVQMELSIYNDDVTSDLIRSYEKNSDVFKDKYLNKIDNKIEEVIKNENMNLKIFDEKLRRVLLNSIFVLDAKTATINKVRKFEDDEYTKTIEINKEQLDRSENGLIESPTNDNSNKIVELELITYNNVATIPIAGKSRPIKQIIGVGDTMFNIKLVLDQNNPEDMLNLNALKAYTEFDVTDIYTELDFGIINAFDIKRLEIANITFTNDNDSDAIIVSIMFSASGYTKEEESYQEDYLLKNKQTSVSDMSVMYRYYSRYLNTILELKSSDKSYGEQMNYFKNYLVDTSEILTDSDYTKTTFEEICSAYRPISVYSEKQVSNTFINKLNEDIYGLSVVNANLFYYQKKEKINTITESSAIKIGSINSVSNVLDLEGMYDVLVNIVANISSMNRELYSINWIEMETWKIFIVYYFEYIVYDIINNNIDFKNSGGGKGTIDTKSILDIIKRYFDIITPEGTAFYSSKVLATFTTSHKVYIDKISPNLVDVFKNIYDKIDSYSKGKKYETLGYLVEIINKMKLLKYKFSGEEYINNQKYEFNNTLFFIPLMMDIIGSGVVYGNLATVATKTMMMPYIVGSYALDNTSSAYSNFINSNIKTKIINNMVNYFKDKDCQSKLSSLLKSPEKISFLKDFNSYLGIDIKGEEELKNIFNVFETQDRVDIIDKIENQVLTKLNESRTNGGKTILENMIKLDTASGGTLLNDIKELSNIYEKNTTQIMDEELNKNNINSEFMYFNTPDLISDRVQSLWNLPKRIETLTKLIKEDYRKVLPTYDIQIINDDSTVQTLLFDSSIHSLNEFIGLDKVINMKVQYSGDTRIATAIIQIIDMSKISQLFTSEVYSASWWDEIQTDNSSKTETHYDYKYTDKKYFRLKVGQVINIKQGYGTDITNIFGGKISSVMSGRVTTIICQSFAAELQTNRMPILWKQGLGFNEVTNLGKDALLCISAAIIGFFLLPILLGVAGVTVMGVAVGTAVGVAGSVAGGVSALTLTKLIGDWKRNNKELKGFLFKVKGPSNNYNKHVIPDGAISIINNDVPKKVNYSEPLRIDKNQPTRVYSVNPLDKIIVSVVNSYSNAITKGDIGQLSDNKILAESKKLEKYTGDDSEEASNYNTLLYSLSLFYNNLNHFSQPMINFFQKGVISSREKALRGWNFQTAGENVSEFFKSNEVSEGLTRLSENINNVDRDISYYGVQSNPENWYIGNSSFCLINEKESITTTIKYHNNSASAYDVLMDMERRSPGTYWDIFPYGNNSTIFFGRSNYNVKTIKDIDFKISKEETYAFYAYLKSVMHIE